MTRANKIFFVCKKFFGLFIARIKSLTHPPYSCCFTCQLITYITCYIINIVSICTHWHCLACSVLSWRHWPTDSSSLSSLACAAWAGVSPRVTPGMRCVVTSHRSLLHRDSLAWRRTTAGASMERKLKPRSLKGCCLLLLTKNDCVGLCACVENIDAQWWNIDGHL